MIDGEIKKPSEWPEG